MKPLVPDPAAVECTFIVPAEIEAKWRNGDRDALAQAVTQIARDTATFCAQRYEYNLTGGSSSADPIFDYLDE